MSCCHAAILLWQDQQNMQGVLLWRWVSDYLMRNSSKNKYTNEKITVEMPCSNLLHFLNKLCHMKSLAWKSALKNPQIVLREDRAKHYLKTNGLFFPASHRRIINFHPLWILESPSRISDFVRFIILSICIRPIDTIEPMQCTLLFYQIEPLKIGPFLVLPSSLTRAQSAWDIPDLNS